MRARSHAEAVAAIGELPGEQWTRRLTFSRLDK
jgi:hypothetical protein